MDKQGQRLLPRRELRGLRGPLLLRQLLNHARSGWNACVSVSGTVPCIVHALGRAFHPLEAMKMPANCQRWPDSLHFLAGYVFTLEASPCTNVDPTQSWKTSLVSESSLEPPLSLPPPPMSPRALRILGRPLQ